MSPVNINLHPDSVLFITIDIVAMIVFGTQISQTLSQLLLYQSPIAKLLHYGSHAAFWMGFTPGITSEEKYVVSKSIEYLE